MSKGGEKILRGAAEALARARGEITEGFVLDLVDVKRTKRCATHAIVNGRRLGLVGKRIEPIRRTGMSGGPPPASAASRYL